MLINYSIFYGVNLVYTTETSTHLSASSLGTQTCTKEEKQTCYPSGVLRITRPHTRTTERDLRATYVPPLINPAITQSA